MFRMKLNKTVTSLVITGTMVLMLGVGGTYAYFTDTKTKVNEFTLGNISINLDEPGWKPENGKNISPNQPITKDPKITNTGTNDAYVFMQVSIPIRSVVVVDEGGKAGEKKKQELFTFRSNKDWTLINKKEVGNNEVYSYYYNRILKPKEVTEPLFNTISLVNITEGELTEEKLTVPVKGYGVQTGIDKEGKDNFDVLAKKAFDKIINEK